MIKSIFFFTWETGKFILVLAYTLAEWALMLWFSVFVFILGAIGFLCMFFATVVFLKMVFNF